MRAALLKAAGEIRLEERAVPAPRPGEALIRVHYVAVCGSDLARFSGQEPVSGPPAVIGHEFCGEVAALGAGVGGPPLGQPVTVAPLLNCGVCSLCRAGRENLCAQRQGFGRNVDGALQDYVAVRADRVFALPSSLPVIEGAFIEPVAVACHAVLRAGLQRPGTALVLGAGAIGLLIAQVWRALGGEPPAIVDLDERRLAVAEALGIPAWKGSPEGPPVHTLFEATGASGAVAAWLPSLGPGGRAVIVGKLEQPVAVNWVELMRKEAEIIPSRYFGLDDFRQALALVGSGQVQVAPLIGAVVPFQRLADEAGQAVMTEARRVIRLVIGLT